jgi:hypothetical protein
MDVIIDNQYSNTALISPVCFTKNVTQHIQFPRKVNPKSTMQTRFITGMDQDTFGGALLYLLQRKEDASISTQILIIWGRKYDTLYSRAWLIEHENTFTWNKRKLKRLYHRYDRRCNVDTIPNGEKWLLNDNKKLRISCEILYKKCFRMDINISEEDYIFRPIKPLWIDTDR